MRKRGVHPWKGEEDPSPLNGKSDFFFPKSLPKHRGIGAKKKEKSRPLSHRGKVE